MATTRPPITAMARGARRSAPRPMPSASGVSPQTVVTVVMTMGRRRTLPASRIASRSAAPRARAWLMNSTLTIASLTTMPTRMTTPIRLMVFRLWPESASASTAPESASGTEMRMITGCRKDSNCAARIM